MTTLCGPPLSGAEGVGPLTLGGFLTEVAGRFADHEALVFDDPLSGGATIRWSYAELLYHARRVAKALVAVGVSKGTRVGILMGNRPESVAAFFGAPMAGAIAVPLSTLLPPARARLSPSSCRHRCVVHPGPVARAQLRRRHRGAVPRDHRGAPDRERLLPISAPGCSRRSRRGTGSVPAGAVQTWEDFLAVVDGVPDAVVDARGAQTSPSDLGLITYSSGTTDRPKEMLHNNRAPTLQFWLLAQVFGRSQTTRLWTALPMFWTAGMNSAMGATLAAGGCWVMQETFEPAKALRLMARERVTEPYTLPHQTAALEEHTDWASTDLSSMTCVFGKSAFARHPSVSGDTGWQMPTGFGLSETCTFFAAHPSNSPRDLFLHSLRRLQPRQRAAGHRSRHRTGARCQ